MRESVSCLSVPSVAVAEMVTRTLRWQDCTGNGGYGRLGHSVQKDEFTPKLVDALRGRMPVDKQSPVSPPCTADSTIEQLHRQNTTVQCMLPTVLLLILHEAPLTEGLSAVYVPHRSNAQFPHLKAAVAACQRGCCPALCQARGTVRMTGNQCGGSNCVFVWLCC